MDSYELSRHAAHVRQNIVKMVTLAQSGHPGGSLSIVDMLQVLYFDVMRIDPKRPHWPDRDRFVLSKGHTVPALYATLAERGFFPEDELWHLRQCGAMLQGNPDMNTTPGIDMTTGSLGQGLSAANGMAMTAKLDGADWRVYVIAGDGEIEEGQIWEAAMSAAQYKLDNLIAFVDWNNLQLDGTCEEIMPPVDLARKFEAFGFQVWQIDGNDMEQVVRALDEALAAKNGLPKCIVGKTVKGKGVSYMENQCGWHGTAPNDEQYRQAMEELDRQYTAC